MLRNNFPQTNHMLSLLLRRDPYGWLDKYGVPGKPLTSNQFFTEDVFRMRVPDDGLVARARGAQENSQAQAADSSERNARSQQWIEDYIERFPDMIIKPENLPGYVPDPGMSVDPEALPPVADCDRYLADALKTKETIESLNLQLDQAKRDVASAKNDRKRAIAANNLQMIEKKIEHLRQVSEENQRFLDKCSKNI